MIIEIVNRKGDKMKEYMFMMQDDSFESRLEQLKTLINNSRHIVFFGGAGVSTESGIPDFRSKDGLYNTPNVGFEKYSPEYLLSHSCLYNNPKVFYEFYRQKLDVRNIEPNITHIKLAEMEKTKDITIVTQNIDGLHQKAGSTKVFDIHGTTLRNYCTNCKRPYPSDYIFTSKEDIPRCSFCGEKGMIRPDVTLYEEQLPKAFKEAIKAVEKADLLIIAGTSLTVYPANTITSYFDGPIVIINRDETPQDKYANIVFRESLGEVFTKL